MTTRFTDELMSQGLTKRILTLVTEISVTREFERLQKERGLGNEKHRKEVGTNVLLVLHKHHHLPILFIINHTGLLL